jgi:hypothetical protein
MGPAIVVVDYDRAPELVALGGRLIELPVSAWRAVAETA